jgi:4-hydroxy-3-polyprenylbenzoate decarboxylase
MTAVKRIVLGVTGASGAQIAIRIGERLRDLPNVETHLVISRAAERTLAHEIGPGAIDRLSRLAKQRYDVEDIGAPIASGSFPTRGMIVAPCSIRTLSAIAAGITDNLLVRAADVQLKERRRLVLVARESPLHLGHLRTMLQVTECGAIVAPPVPAFYLLPRDIGDMVDHFARRMLDLLQLGDAPLSTPWTGLL